MMKPKKKQLPRILWCCVSRDDGTILAEAESYLNQREEDAVIETAQQLLSQTTLPLAVGKTVENTQEDMKHQDSTRAEVMRELVLHPHKELRRRRRTPLKGMMLIAASGKQKEKNKSKKRNWKKPRKERKKKKPIVVVREGEAGVRLQERVKVRSDDVSVATTDSESAGTVASKRLIKTKRAPPPKLRISAVYNPTHCSSDQVLTFLKVISDSIVGEERNWMAMGQLGLQESVAPVMLEWMEDVSYLAAVAHLQGRVDSLTTEMQSNLETLKASTENAEELYEMSLVLLDRTRVFKKKSKALKKQYMSRSVKYTVAIGTTVTAFLGVGILFAVL